MLCLLFRFFFFVLFAAFSFFALFSYLIPLNWPRELIKLLSPGQRNFNKCFTGH